ncbi:hypothetical protein A33O_15001 [Nitratireductor aquibiodomus RA22]|uniref:DUF3489 domain-containing protein n=1 Tax=Nitratireductor aquibiodomus RA22 TaxID=1189611 RepID=I5BVA5_9HYPH|nr:DUF3489 domain-containing protein [Nitratireductor aquibiodomus]EIM73507.1 hypothetical protein A33O_15001 [Nitratireductor aquibiodomus RA22]
MNISQHDADIAEAVVPEAAVGSDAKAAVAKSHKRRKKDQLIALLAKPNGARASLIAERLGWQAHTVRAALSRLRKEGHPIVMSKSPKTGETVYAIAAKSSEQTDTSDAVSA